MTGEKLTWSQEELETVDRGILAAAEGGFSV